MRAFADHRATGEQHRAHRHDDNPQAEARAHANCRRELEGFLEQSLKQVLAEKLNGSARLEAYVAAIHDGDVDIYPAADEMLSEMGLG